MSDHHILSLYLPKGLRGDLGDLAAFSDRVRDWVGPERVVRFDAVEKESGEPWIRIEPVFQVKVGPKNGRDVWCPTYFEVTGLEFDWLSMHVPIKAVNYPVDWMGPFLKQVWHPIARGSNAFIGFVGDEEGATPQKMEQIARFEMPPWVYGCYLSPSFATGFDKALLLRWTAEADQRFKRYLRRIRVPIDATDDWLAQWALKNNERILESRPFLEELPDGAVLAYGDWKRKP